MENKENVKVEKEIDYGIYDLQIEPQVEINTETISLEAQAEAEYEREEREAIQSETYVPVEIPRMMLMGVIPENEARWEIVDHESYCSKKENWLKKLFNRLIRFIKKIGEKV